MNELDRIRIVRPLILNYFWKEMTQDVVFKIVGIWEIIFLHIKIYTRRNPKIYDSIYD
jgi:hypothetical protein